MVVNLRLSGVLRLHGAMYHSDVSRLADRVHEKLVEALDEVLLEYPELEYHQHEMEVANDEK